MFSRWLVQSHPLRWQSLTELDEEYGMHRDLRLVRMQYKRTRGKENPMPKGKEGRRKETGEKGAVEH